jgi:hypothetical protein
LAPRTRSPASGALSRAIPERGFPDRRHGSRSTTPARLISPRGAPSGEQGLGAAALLVALLGDELALLGEELDEQVVPAADRGPGPADHAERRVLEFVGVCHGRLTRLLGEGRGAVGGVPEAVGVAADGVAPVGVVVGVCGRLVIWLVTIRYCRGLGESIE